MLRFDAICAGGTVRTETKNQPSRTATMPARKAQSFGDLWRGSPGNGRRLNVAQGSQWNAGLYDDKHSFVWKMAAGLLDLLEAKPGEHILDLGCGTGHLTAQIAACGAIVVGIDRSPDMF